MAAAPASPAAPLRVNVQQAGVLPGNPAAVNDAALARLIDAIPSLGPGQTFDLLFPADLRAYQVSRPINPDRAGLRLVSDGPGARLVMTGRADPLLMLGFGKRPKGQALTAAHAFDLYGRMDASVASGPGQRFGFRTRDDTHLSQFSSGLAVLPEDLATLRVEYAYDSTDTFEHWAPIAGQDGRWYLIDGSTWEVWIYTQAAPYGAISRNRFLFPGPDRPGIHRVSVQVDISRLVALAFVDGLEVPVRIDRRAPPGDSNRLAPDEARPFGLGGVAPTSTTHGNDWWGGDWDFDRAIAGFALHAAAAYADDGPGTPQRRLDGRAITDHLRYQDSEAQDLIGLLPFTDVPMGDRWNDRLLTVMGNQALPYRRSSAFVMAREHDQVLGPGFGVRGMVLESPGDCIAVGTALGLDLRDSWLTAGPTGRAIGSWNCGASYFHRARHCSLQGGAAALYANLNMWSLEDCDVRVHGRNTFWLVNSSVGLRRSFTTGFGAPERVVYAVGCPRVLVEDLHVDIEDFGHPSRALVEARTSVAMGGVLHLLRLTDLNVGGLKPGTPLVILGAQQATPAGRFDLVGLNLGGKPTDLDSFVRVESPNWRGTVDVDYDHPTLIRWPAGSPAGVVRVGPSAPRPIPGQP